MIRLDGQHLSCTALHAIGHGDVCSAAPGARAAMSRNAASTPAGEDVLRAKELWESSPGRAAPLTVVESGELCL